MNKEELIEKINNLSYILTWNRPHINREIVIDLIEQLDEPQKVVVPQFVADWYEENKDDFEGNLFRCINTISSMYEDEELNDFENWVIEAHTEPFQTLVNMHQFGYEVEKEKRYRVSLKNGQPLLKAYSGKALYFSQDIAIERCKVTRKELDQAGFGWVFDCPGIEIEEVAE